MLFENLSTKLKNLQVLMEPEDTQESLHTFYGAREVEIATKFDNNVEFKINQGLFRNLLRFS